jgi:sugar lactone lactonase YvrE
MIITPDQRTLIVAESFGARLTAFSIERNGDLTHRRIWAEIEGSSPDGICFDDAGGVWVASPASGTCFRVEEGGQITDELTPEATPFACILGGALGKTLFILIAPSSHPDKCAADAKGKIVSLDVAHARAGNP